MSEPQYRHPHPLRPDNDIVYVNWHVSSHAEMDAGYMSSLAVEWWEGTAVDERERALDKVRVSIAEMATKESGRPIGVGEVSYTVRRGTGRVLGRPDEEPTP